MKTKSNLKMNLNWSVPYNLSDQQEINFDEFKKEASIIYVIKNFRRYDVLNLKVISINNILRPNLVYPFLKLLCKGAISISDIYGRKIQVTYPYIVKLTLKSLLFTINIPRLRLRRILNRVNDIRCADFKKFDDGTLKGSRGIYIRSDPVAISTGGAQSHILGVCNALCSYVSKLYFVSNSDVRGLNQNIKRSIVHHREEERCFPKLLEIQNSDILANHISDNIPNLHEIDFIYQRYSLNNFSGAIVANKYSKPLILEYNGSEVWIKENWGKGVKNYKLLKEIEESILASASFITCVSTPLRDELLAIGVSADKILVNPNCVDLAEYYCTDHEDSMKEYGVPNGGRVVGFVGTFGKWHGVELLVEAFQEIAHDPALKDVYLVLFGSGETYSDVRNLVSDRNLQNRVLLPGLIDRSKVPNFLNCCKVLVSPQRPNLDGSPFFGSPTKLFEYMASKTPIVASNLDQISEILSHEKNALLFNPNDPNSLAKSIRQVLSNSELAKTLSENAFQLVSTQFTWKKHVERIFIK